MDLITLDNKGYVISGLTLLLIIPALIMSLMLVNLINMDESTDQIKYDSLYHISNDLDANIPVLTREVLKENTAKVLMDGHAIPNSRMVIKTGLQTKIDDITENYGKETGASIQCTIKSINSPSDPYEIEIESEIVVNKENNSINRNISQNVSFMETEPKGKSVDCRIPDPLPFIKTKKYGAISVDGNRIHYGSTLSQYLKSKGINNSQIYENASSPLYFKPCPYDPYTSHGSCNMLINLKNCIDNGYYHKSNDGACLLCRLEGKATCDHMGLETFIVPLAGNYSELNGPCSIDHVIFSENGPQGYGTYPGKVVEYYYSYNRSNGIYLDNGHRNKYGISL